jgi:hypothetical protein
LGWEANFDLWLDRLKKRRASGEADEEEAWPLTNLEHTVLMYDLMMKQVIENLDPIAKGSMDDATSDPTAPALNHLVDHIDDTLEQSTDEIWKTLSHAVQHDYLRLTQKDGYSHWEWVDYL